ncbi:zinc finger protein 414 isoform X2 [Sphaeramia orbicularis]|uniref:zinc finger protein 414 isoform X2 n=1 Tax=Sphaeramia orbicularis TaxID=375764 RepID=UPI00117C2A32|nr:zinc finger protein 414 isoform X2 [Sphaeramia orbicularis]
MMSSGPTTTTEALNSGQEANKRAACPLYGCKRVYADMNALQTHIKDHEIPAQSLPGKVLLCSTIGCSGSFPDMQKLMEHMRHHHKPNIFFLCESCRTKLRSYRGLLTHLHTCSKVPRGQKKPPEATPSQPTAVTPMAVDQNPQQPDSAVTTPQQQSSQVPDGATQMDLAPPPGSSNPQLPPPQLTEALPQLKIDPSQVSLPLKPEEQKAPDPTETQIQQQPQTRSPEPVHPLGPASQSPPGLSAVWKKNQGLTCSRRILWEHTKGRYTCIQCGHSVTNRKDMTQHINTHHSGNRPTEDTANAVTNT